MTIVDEAPRPPADPTGPGGPPASADGHGDVDERPIRPRSFGRSDVAEVGGAAVSALCLVWLVFERLTPMTGALGATVCWFAAFVLIAYLVARQIHGPVRAKDRVAAIVITGAGLGLVVPLTLIAGYVLVKGYHALRPQFFTQDQRYVGSLSSATEGGGLHAIVGTLEQVGLAVVISVPLGISTALFLNEVRGKLSRPVRLVVDAMSATPSIVAGLFIYAAIILGLGYHFSGFAAALALSVLMLPTVTRTAEVVLRLVPGGLREAGLALGGAEWRTVRHVVLPTARTGLVTAVILGVARIVGETAPLILTAGGAFQTAWNPFRDQQDALPLFVYRLVRFPAEAQKQRAWTGALVLLLLVLTLFLIARLLGGQGPGHIGRFKRRRLRRKGLL